MSEECFAVIVLRECIVPLALASSCRIRDISNNDGFSDFGVSIVVTRSAASALGRFGIYRRGQDAGNDFE